MKMKFMVTLSDIFFFSKEAWESAIKTTWDEFDEDAARATGLHVPEHPYRMDRNGGSHIDIKLEDIWPRDVAFIIKY